MELSVILATFRRQDILKNTLSSFTGLRFDKKWEVILVDNGCEEPVRALAESFKGKVPIQYLPENSRGKNFAINSGIAKAAGKVIIFTDDDVLVPPDWLEKFYTGTSRWPDHNIFGGRILPHWPGGKEPGFIRKNEFYNMAYGMADWDFPEGEYPAGKVWGPNMAVRRKIFDEGHRYNTTIGPSVGKYMMGSETEFTTRMEKLGHRAVFLPEVVVQHQIREEQLDEAWLIGRAFRYGRSFPVTANQLNSARLFGVPRYFYGLLWRNFLKRLTAFDGKARLDLAIEASILKGQMHQIRTGNGQTEG